MTTLETTLPILIIEDNDDDFEVTEYALKKKAKFANPIYRCENATQALEYLLYAGMLGGSADYPRPGLILLDLNMPGKDGRELLKEIKGDPGMKTIPVVVLTTSDDERDIEVCYKGGANTYIKKPVDLEGFFAAMQHLKDYWFSVALLPQGKVEG